jgi:hypothetical protein
MFPFSLFSQFVGGFTASGRPQTILVTDEGKVVTDSGGGSLPEGAATEAKQDDAISLLDGIVTEAASTASIINALEQRSGRVETPTRSVVIVSGTVAAGATSVTIVSSEDFSGTVLGVAFSPSRAETFNAQPGNTLAAIVYTRAAGFLTITRQTAA